MVFITNDNGCYVCISHKTTKEGYLRKKWRSGYYKSDQEMFHRYIYRCVNGDIPDGYEVDHKCRFKNCCNPEHLQVLSVYDHRAKTNRERSEDLREEVKAYWLANGQPRPTDMVDQFGKTVFRWIRQWKQELNDVHKEKEISH